MRIPKPAAVLRRVRAFGPAPAYAAVALLATAFFFFLHYVGNSIPYELAQQRFRAEFEAGRPDEGQARGYKDDYEYCQISETVMAGAKWARGRRAVDDAVVLRTFGRMPGGRMPGVDGRYCHELAAAANGAEPVDLVLKPRYWWGSKALYAIALRYLSVHEIRELTLAATRAAYLLLAVVLVAFAPRTLPATAPLLVLGAFSSGLEYWADVANGTPYLWTVASAAVLAGLLRVRRSSGVFSGAVPVWCFAAGTVSSYLWLGDGHTFLAATWIGLLVWFGGGAPGAAERTRRAVSCIALYAAGFVACHGLGQIVKAVVWDYERMWGHWYRGVGKVVNASVADVSTEGHLSTYLESFYAMAWPGWLPAGVFPTTAAASSLAVAAGFVVFRRRGGLGGTRDPLRGVPWIVGLLAVNSLSFLIGEHYPYRTARFVFVPLALCCSCLILCVRATDWKLSSAVLGTVLVVSGSVSWYFDSFDARAAGRLIASVEDVRPFVSAGFDVRLDGDRLVYVKEDCRAEDVVAAFFLHLYPVDEADLPEHRRRHGFDNLDFAFEKYGVRGGGRCAAARDLPEYRIASIHTGQYVFGQDPEWSGRVRPTDSRTIDDLFASVEDARPVISSGFDAYLDGNRLVYVKEDCGDEDVAAWFFLHLYPVDEADLPDSRKPHGFDNLDFAFERYGFRAGGRCAAVRVLPEYEVASVHTGQFVPGRDPDWDERVYLDQPDVDR